MPMSGSPPRESDLGVTWAPGLLKLPRDPVDRHAGEPLTNPEQSFPKYGIWTSNKQHNLETCKKCGSLRPLPTRTESKIPGAAPAHCAVTAFQVIQCCQTLGITLWTLLFLFERLRHTVIYRRIEEADTVASIRVVGRWRQREVWWFASQWQARLEPTSSEGRTEVDVYSIPSLPCCLPPANRSDAGASSSGGR